MQNLTDIRNLMCSQQVDVLLVTNADPHLSEYPSEEWKERSWLSGFTGSNGMFVVTQTKTMLWTDSRYELQSAYQMAGTAAEIVISSKLQDVADWLRKNLSRNAVVGFHGECFSVKTVEFLQTQLQDFEFRSVDFISPLWKERPKPQNRPFFVLDEKFAGCSAVDKLAKVRQELRKRSTSCLLLTALDEIAWLLNIRGYDVMYNPVVEAFLLITDEKCVFFCDTRKVTLATEKYLNAIGVDLAEQTSLAEKLSSSEKIWADKSKLNFDIFEKIQYKLKVTYPTPVNYFKSIKNDVEIAGVKNACVKDGVALVRFNIWLEKALREGEVITELSVAEKLYEFRAMQSDFWGESFGSIVAYADHGAIVHYSATADTNTRILPHGFLLIDSGGQYFDGTTDITRTFALGELTEQQRRDYTLVLKGNIALASVIFPDGTTGPHLDVLARQFLWKNALGYGHGTGHGIGHFLNVHEGPQAIRPDQNNVALKPGMLTSDEPGIYRAGEYGIRLENMILTEIYTKSDFGSFFHNRTLTLFPFENDAIDFSLLSDDEKHWLKNYYADIYEKLSPFLNEEERVWLNKKLEF